MIERRHFSAAGFRRLFAMVAIGATATLLTATAQATPMTPAKSAVTESQVLQVRDGCGRDMRYSERRGGCVEDFDGGPPGPYRGPPDYDRRPPPPDYDRRPPPDYRGGPDYRGDPRGPAMPDCGRGMRFSNSRQACVRIEGAVEDRGNDDVATGALIRGAVGALVGSAIQNDANRPQQQPVQRRP
jgi:hypothetical protein